MGSLQIADCWAFWMCYNLQIRGKHTRVMRDGILVGDEVVDFRSIDLGEVESKSDKLCF